MLNAGQTPLKDFPFIDRKTSKLDEKRSNPEKGIYICNAGDEVKYNLRDPKTGKHSDWWFRWAENSPKRISILMSTKGYDFVHKTDDIVPLGMPTDAEGHYIFGDLVLMKRPLESYLMEQQARMNRGKGKPKAILDKFRSDSKKSGVNLPDGEYDELLDGLSY